MEIGSPHCQFMFGSLVGACFLHICKGAPKMLLSTYLYKDTDFFSFRFQPQRVKRWDLASVYQTQNAKLFRKNTRNPGFTELCNSIAYLTRAVPGSHKPTSIPRPTTQPQEHHWLVGGKVSNRTTKAEPMIGAGEGWSGGMGGPNLKNKTKQQTKTNPQRTESHNLPQKKTNTNIIII